MKFSDRIGVTQADQFIQIESVDETLRNHLWNALDLYYWKTSNSRYMVPTDAFGAKSENKISLLLKVIWNSFFNYRIDQMSDYVYKNIKVIDDFFYTCEWYDVYNFLEFIITHDDNTERKNDFKKICNTIFENDQSGYRFIGDFITPISSEIEIKALDKLMRNSDKYLTVKKHIEQALSLFVKRPAADYRNSIKESISSVEAICCTVSGKEKASLGDAINLMQKKGFPMHPAFVEAVKKLYGFTCNAEGIRHSLLEEAKLTAADAKFMLVICAAFVNYIIEIESRN